MSQYTATLRRLINDAHYDLQLTNYPLFDSNYRNTLNNKIINHFMFREYSADTPDQFRFFLNRKLNEIMPYYNELYRSAALNYDILTNSNTHETFERTDCNTSHSTGSASENSNDSSQSSSTNGNTTSQLALHAQTPASLISLQDDLTGQGYADDVSRQKVSVSGNDYVTSGSNGSSYNSTVNNAENNGTENYVRNLTGNNGAASFPKLIQDFRDAIINIDMLIIDELEVCFIPLF